MNRYTVTEPFDYLVDEGWDHMNGSTIRIEMVEPGPDGDMNDARTVNAVEFDGPVVVTSFDLTHGHRVVTVLYGSEDKSGTITATGPEWFDYIEGGEA